jgi:hypothetical protein
LNHQRAWQSKKHRTWLGERTEAIAGLATTAPFAAGNLVSATSGATISSVKERSGRWGKERQILQGRKGQLHQMSRRQAGSQR